MPASEQILIDISLFSFSPGWTNITELWNITSAVYLYSAPVRAEVTQNIGTSPNSDVVRNFMRVINYNFFNTCIFLLTGLIVHGQNIIQNKPNGLFGVKDLVEVDSSEIYSMAGVFSLSDGFGGYSYSVDSNGSFKRRDFSCVDNRISDSGIYKLKSKGQIQLISNRKSGFVAYRFDKFYFLVPLKKIELFKEEFLSYAKLYAGLKPRTIDGELYSNQFFIALNLMRHYLTRFD